VLTGVLFATIFTLIGFAFIPSKYSQTFFYFPVGVIYFVILVAVISSISNLSVGFSSVIAIFFSTLLLIYRIFKNSSYRDLLKSFGKIQVTVPYILIILTNSLVSFLNLDLAGRNFDAYYAIQDGTFLASHSVFESRKGLFPDSLLPLDWSASTSIRYGVSLVLASTKFILHDNLWTQAQPLFILLFIILFLVLYSFSKSVFKINNFSASCIAVLATFSPMYLLHIQYFMFGQALTLPLLIFSFILFSDFNPSWESRFLQIAMLACLFIAYPAMFYPLFGFYLISLIFDFIRTKKYYNIAANLGLFSLILTFAYDFDFGAIGNRIFSWVVGSVSPATINITNSDLITIPIFSQFTSDIGFPLIFGFLPYPFSGNVPTILIYTLNLLCLSIFVLVLSLLFPWNKSDARMKAVILYLIFWCIFPFFGFVRGNSYLFFKISVWLMPILMLLFAGKFFDRTSFVISTGTSKGAAKRNMLRIFITTILIAQSVTSLSYLKSMKGWDSFPQRPSTKEYPNLLALNFPPESIISISTPTAEEATWTAGLINANPAKIFSLGASQQALAVGLNRRCELSYVQKNFDSVDYLIENTEKQDVVENLVFNSISSGTGSGWRKYSVLDLKYGVVPNGAGSYPPTFLENGNSPVNNAKIIRWSSGQICLSIFSKNANAIKLQLNYANGPDIGPMPVWEGSLNSQRLPLVVSGQEISTNLNLDSGWNLFQIVQKSCKDPMENFNRWSRRADDRLLCFAYGSVRTFRSN
jgi:hypothetical protein